MPTRLDPMTAGWHNKFVVHFQRFNGCSPNGCYPDDVNAILTPTKMFMPVLLARMKERND